MTITEKAINTYGIPAQLMVAVEELSELQKEICKLYRGKGNEQHLAEEIADVFIMITQVKQIAGIREEDIKSWIDLKMNRLERSLQGFDKDNPQAAEECEACKVDL